MPESPPLSLILMGAAGVAVLAGCGVMEKLVRGLRQQRDAGLGAGFYLAAALGALQVGLTGWALWQAELAPTQTSHDAVMLVGLVYALFHGGLAVILTVLQGLRVGYGYVGAHAPFEPGVVALLWRYNVVTFGLLIAALAVLPRVLGG